MAEISQPLGLIQRAIKRLGGELKPGPAHAPIADEPSRKTPPFTGVPGPQEEPARSGPNAGNGFAEPIGAPPELRTTRAIGAAPRAPGAASREIRLNFSALRRNGVMTPEDKTSPLSNEFRLIKRKLLATARNPTSRALVDNLVMITSALPGEGKTFVSLNLALSLAAERDIHVLLIDCDFIRPNIDTVFEANDGEGLTDLLNGACQRVSDVMYRCADVPNLSVIFAGNRDESSPELVGSRRMVDLLADFSKRYPDRLVIIDSPPVLVSPEPAILAMHVHQLIMVVAAAQSDRTQLRKALESVSACRNINLLFNKAPKWQQAHGNYYYYGGANTERK